jgi:hypothetical protein
MEPITIPVICDRCRVEGAAGEDPFTAIRDLLEFEPVPRRAHVNNWTAEHQRAFIAALALTGSPRMAARALGRHAFGAEQLRSAKGGRSFADAWDAALALYREREFFRIRENLSHLAEQQEARDGGELVGSHLRALPPPVADGAWSEPEYDDEDGADDYDPLASIRRKLLACRRLYLAEISTDPAKRAAWEVLVGPVDWDKADGAEPQADERPVHNMRKPDMVLTVASGWVNSVVGTPEEQAAVNERAERLYQSRIAAEAEDDDDDDDDDDEEETDA